MEDSLIHELLALKLYEFRKKIKNEEDIFDKWVKETREKLENSLNTEQLKLVDEHIYNLSSKEEDIELQYEIKLLNYGIKIGMQLQKAFYRFSEDLNPPLQ